MAIEHVASKLQLDWVLEVNLSPSEGFSLLLVFSFLLFSRCSPVAHPQCRDCSHADWKIWLHQSPFCCTIMVAPKPLIRHTVLNPLLHTFLSKWPRIGTTLYFRISLDLQIPQQSEHSDIPWLLLSVLTRGNKQPFVTAACTEVIFIKEQKG